jgi:LacI family transcriptional regulator
MGTRKTLLMLSDNSGEDYIARLRAGAARVLGASGFDLASINVHGRPQSTEEALRTSDCAGLILTAPACDDRHLLTVAESIGIPLVRIAAMLDPERGNTVGMDEFEAASAITAVLTARGHRRIAIMRGPNSHLVSMRRYNGYANALGAKGIRIDQSLVAQGDFTRQSGRDQAAKLFAARPSAIFASNDEMAAGIIDAARGAGIAIPRDISLVGYDDNAVATHVSPRLTTVRQPLEAMGEAAGRLLLERLRNPRQPNGQAIVPFEIVERDSVADPPEGAGG